ncbi:hypothetical protein E2C01_040100 [Portunus trituberculatus]|uniref:Uncharacterized protein n=1 Tax=Portunus trituberculatus TaxID=210409 RepID=A0A5B7FMD8_PORTR|nr:hypothetical protein [Portunus trituberculatus]
MQWGTWREEQIPRRAVVAKRIQIKAPHGQALRSSLFLPASSQPVLDQYSHHSLSDEPCLPRYPTYHASTTPPPPSPLRFQDSAHPPSTTHAAGVCALYKFRINLL